MSRVSLSRYLIEQTRSHNTPADLRFLIEVVARVVVCDGEEPGSIAQCLDWQPGDTVRVDVAFEDDMWQQYKNPDDTSYKRVHPGPRCTGPWPAGPPV